MNNNKFYLLMAFFCWLVSFAYGQDETLATRKDPLKTYIIQEFNGDVFVGRVVYEDPSMIKFEVKKLGIIVIHKRDIEVIREMTKHLSENLGDYVPSESFSSRYFLTSNALPLRTHEDFSDMNLFGPDLHKIIVANLDASISSSWLFLPLMVNLKYTIQPIEGLSLGAGVLGGWGSWAYNNTLGLFPYAMATLGDRKDNLTISYGRGTLVLYGNPEQRNMFTAGGFAKAGKRTSIVFDSFILPSSNPQTSGFTIVIPGIRFQSDNRSAFQVGLGGVFLSGTFLSEPIPFIQWFRHL